MQKHNMGIGIRPKRKRIISTSPGYSAMKLC